MQELVALDEVVSRYQCVEKAPASKLAEECVGEAWLEAKL